jgi:hypothetical protein
MVDTDVLELLEAAANRILSANEISIVINKIVTEISILSKFTITVDKVRF